MKCDHCEDSGFIEINKRKIHCTCKTGRMEHKFNDKKRTLQRQLQLRALDYENVVTFNSIREIKGFIETESFNSCIDLYQKIKAKHKPQALFLTGGHGRGKTLSATALVWETLRFYCGLDRNFKKIAVFKFDHLVREFKKSFEGQFEELMSEIGSSSLLIIDEIGRETPIGNPEHAKYVIDRIVDACYQKRLLVFISNYSLKGLQSYLSSYTSSRLNERAGYCRFIEEPFNDDLRKK